MDIVDPRIDPKLVPHGSRARVYARNQPQYNNLPSVATPSGIVITRWSPTEDERRQILLGEDIYLATHTFNKPIQPISMSVGPQDWSDE
jgi:hypothetical protein